MKILKLKNSFQRNSLGIRDGILEFAGKNGKRGRCPWSPVLGFHEEKVARVLTAN